MNTRSIREHNMFVPTRLLRSWREQRPSNKGDLDMSNGGGRKGVLHGVDVRLTLFLS
jgi:hypothetical protein